MNPFAWLRAFWPHCPIHGASTWPWPCTSCVNLSTRVKALSAKKRRKDGTARKGGDQS